MIILPTRQSDNGLERAQQFLQEVIEQRRKVTLVVFGEGDRAREIASRADVRADDHPARQVVWMPDPSVLGEGGVAGFAKLKELADSGAEAAFFTLEFELSSRISGENATRFSKLELGFAEALAGKVEG